jgi:hypothetical protein
MAIVVIGLMGGGCKQPTTPGKVINKKYIVIDFGGPIQYPPQKLYFLTLHEDFEDDSEVIASCPLTGELPGPTIKFLLLKGFPEERWTPWTYVGTGPNYVVLTIASIGKHPYDPDFDENIEEVYAIPSKVATSGEYTNLHINQFVKVYP